MPYVCVYTTYDMGIRLVRNFSSWHRNGRNFQFTASIRQAERKMYIPNNMKSNSDVCTHFFCLASRSNTQFSSSLYRSEPIHHNRSTPLKCPDKQWKCLSSNLPSSKYCLGNCVSASIRSSKTLFRLGSTSSRIDSVGCPISYKFRCRPLTRKHETWTWAFCSILLMVILV